MLRKDLPEGLGSAFTTARAREAGVTRSRLRGSDLLVPYRGVRAVAVPTERLTPEAAVWRRVEQYLPRMLPGEFFSHATAAVLWRLPVPLRLADGDLLDVSVLSPHRLPRTRGIRGHEVRPHLVTLRRHGSLDAALSSPASTWALLGAVMSHPYDLVAVGDAVVRQPQHPHDPPAMATVTQLAAAVGAGRRVGVNALRDALPRVRTGCSSRPETWTRLTLIDGGLPEPELGFVVRDRAGSFIGRIDLAYPKRKVAVEYEGEQHPTDRAQWIRDIRRYERLAAEGWTVIRVTREELFTRPGNLVHRVRRALTLAAR